MPFDTSAAGCPPAFVDLDSELLSFAEAFQSVGRGDCPSVIVVFGPWKSGPELLLRNALQCWLGGAPRCTFLMPSSPIAASRSSSHRVRAARAAKPGSRRGSLSPRCLVTGDTSASSRGSDAGLPRNPASFVGMGRLSPASSSGLLAGRRAVEAVEAARKSVGGQDPLCIAAVNTRFQSSSVATCTHDLDAPREEGATKIHACDDLRRTWHRLIGLGA
eukprot:scaffold34_cov260-Pinguiococcus_pyrenoidosus.AAC.23